MKSGSAHVSTSRPAVYHAYFTVPRDLMHDQQNPEREREREERDREREREILQ